jgi:hypothetical protein
LDKIFLSLGSQKMKCRTTPITADLAKGGAKMMVWGRKPGFQMVDSCLPAKPLNLTLGVLALSIS